MDKDDDYRARINLVTNYVAGNLDKPQTIDQLAEIAHFSKFHFHRIFRAFAGETIHAIVSRLRLERAAASLIYHKNRSITQVAMDHGFSSAANFTKAFTKHFGWSPSVYRAEQSREIKNSKIGKVPTSDIIHNKHIEHEVKIRRQSELHLAYLRHKGTYHHMEITAMHREVRQWVEDHDCGALEPVSLGITWSDSHIVDEENWVYDACSAVQPGTKGDGGIGIQKLPAGLVAQLEIELEESDSYDLSPYWDWFVGRWFVSSGYELRSCPSFEWYLESDQYFIVRLCLPLEP